MATHFSIFAWRIPVDRGAWWATVHGVTESDKTEHVCTIIEFQYNCEASPVAQW